MDATVLTEADGLHYDLYFVALALDGEIARVFTSDASGNSDAMAGKLLGSKWQGNRNDPASLLARVKPQLVIVTMAPESTPAAVDAALDSGCHVITEKPGFLRLEDFERLQQKAAAKKLLLSLVLPNRVDPYMLEARRLITGGAIGKVYGVEIHIVADQTRLADPAYAQDWRARKASAGGGHLSWLGIHWIDLAGYITGSRIAAVAAFTSNVGGKPFDVEDSAAVTMRFEDGTLGTLTSGYYIDKGFDTQIKVWGSNGWVLVQKHTDAPLQWYSNREGEVHRMKPVPAEAGGIYGIFIRAVTRACLGMSAPPLTAADSLAALQVVRACYRAAQTGQTQRLV